MDRVLPTPQQQDFFSRVAPNDEFAIANRMKELALEELSRRSIAGDSAKYIGLFLLGHWIERTTKVLLTYHRRDVSQNPEDLNELNRKQSHRIVDAIDEIVSLATEKQVAPALFVRVRDCIADQDVRTFLQLIDDVLNTKVARYSNLETMIGPHEDFAYMMNFDTVLSDAIALRFGEDRDAFYSGNFSLATKHIDTFISSIVEVLTFAFHFPIGWGLFGARAKQELAGRFHPNAPERSMFDYLVNKSAV